MNITLFITTFLAAKSAKTHVQQGIFKKFSERGPTDPHYKEREGGGGTRDKEGRRRGREEGKRYEKGISIHPEFSNFNSPVEEHERAKKVASKNGM